MKNSKPAVRSHDDYEVHDAMHTMMRAGEIVKDKKLMAKVKVKAREHSRKMKEVAGQADALARRGLISEKAMAKHVRKGKTSNQGGKVADLDKTQAIA